MSDLRSVLHKSRHQEKPRNSLLHETVFTKISSSFSVTLTESKHRNQSPEILEKSIDWCHPFHPTDSLAEIALSVRVSSSPEMYPSLNVLLCR